MKERSNILKYEAKGYMTRIIDGDIIEVLGKKDAVDTVSLNEFVLDMKEWCENNMEKVVVIRMTATASEPK